jgi:predicted RNase H-like nuclease (RuvC/YqgF family)
MEKQESEIQHIDNVHNNEGNDESNDELQESINSLTSKIDELGLKMGQMQSTIDKLSSENEKLKNQVSDKISKFIFAELENKIIGHTKSIDTQSKKLFELQNNVHAFVQQPIALSVIDNIRKQIIDEIMENVQTKINELSDQVYGDIDKKTAETLKQINNAKRVMFHK